MFKEAVHRFRIPQYGFEKRIKEKDKNLWRLTKPQLINNSYIVYSISGKDSLGPFGGDRRYRDFHTLRNVISHNWPGIYVPNIPPKKAVGNKDIEFVIERMYFLERFFMKLSEVEYLKNSEEMRIFARPEITNSNLDCEK
jgi:hypothetical protein